MKINWHNILEGWSNHLIPRKEIKELINATSIGRLEICRDCSWNSKNAGKRGIERCLECGCPLVAKTKCLSCYCGINKWEAVITEQQEELLNENESPG
jgi:hypothetical protein